MPHDNQTPEESQKIKTAIQVAHAQTGVDPRLLMAIIMQESHGELRVHTTIAPDGSKSGGLMQCAGCPSAEGIIKDGYIPQDLVNQMVIGGAIHYKGNLDRAANRNVFEAFRLYNSGSANLNDLNDGMAATGPYVWEVANRLHGWRN
jgi:hypothetical protein